MSNFTHINTQDAFETYSYIPYWGVIPLVSSCPLYPLFFLFGHSGGEKNFKMRMLKTHIISKDQAIAVLVQADFTTTEHDSAMWSG